MDFFQQQDRSRRSTKFLVFYFGLAVVGIIIAVYLACLLAFAGATSKARQRGRAPEVEWWDPRVFSYVALGTVAVIAGGCFYKIAELSSGGSAVAESLGGRRVNSGTTDAGERRLLNVVEEMSIASGVPMPQVYVMDGESGINAFAAGHTTGDAAVAVTRGCLQSLNRDELQGVIGHEFSHILNGDMRLNLRLMGIIFGILCLTVIGRILLRTRGRKNPLPVLGLVLIAVGWVGVFFGRLIQAAVSRQREFLADASAVQFTRNPAGLSGALQKIGHAGSRLASEHAQEASHMFFSSGLGTAFLNAFATHPPLEERIRAIEPAWDGKFKAIESPAAEPLPGRSYQKPAASRLAPIRSQIVLPSVGNPTPQHLRYAGQLRASFPDAVKTAAGEPGSAVALIYALLLSADETTRAQQLQGLAGRVDAVVCEQIGALHREVAELATRARLPLVNLALTALRQLSPEDYRRFSETLQWLIHSDAQLDLFEFTLQKIIRRHLEPQFAPARRAVVQYYSIKPLLPDCGVLLSTLARIGSEDATEIEAAFRQAVPHLRIPGSDGPWLLPRELCTLESVDAALNRLAATVPLIKKNLMEACIQVVGADGVIHEREAELLRAVGDTLDCPIPPFVGGE
ncbi:MAG: M48 family metalloprotease [Verrucomicrobia bacterium]|nr:M48 family metalloprotease [Verrucomicrobiota bacterium]